MSTSQAPRHLCITILCLLAGKGLFYNRYVGPEGLKGELGTETDINENQQLCFHKLGAPQEQDAVIWIDPEHPQVIVEGQIWSTRSECRRRQSKSPISPGRDDHSARMSFAFASLAVDVPRRGV